MTHVAIIGAAGYTGGELIRLLLRHPAVGEARITAVSASHAGHPVSDVHPDLAGETQLRFATSFDDAEVIFLCQGHGKARTWMQEHAPSASTKVIDLSVDHRLDGAWTYGLPEAHRDVIRAATRVANPGCFATSIELALLPLRGHLRDAVHVTAITGSTGAGQAASDTTHYSWRANNIGVYKAFDHQHLPEIARTVGYDDIVFIPMRGSWTRGILASCVVRTTTPIDALREHYAAAYDGHPFTHVVDDLPDVKRVVGTNKCLIGLQPHGDHVLIVSVIDNLLKGASGQAVQNMNLMCGLDETDGLLLKPIAY
jgi:N-acetyl-gamma-glutamyl-phosphate reductase